MDNSDKNNELIEAYLRDSLKGDELQNFKAKLAKDATLAEEVSQLKELVDVLDEDTWTLSEFEGLVTKLEPLRNFSLDPRKLLFANAPLSGIIRAFHATLAWPSL